MDDVWMGAMTDTMYNEQTVGNFTRIHAGKIPHVSPHSYQGILMCSQLMVVR